MENNDDETWNDETEINPEAWLQVLLAITSDEKHKADFVRKLSEKTGQPLHEVEAILTATINFLAEKARSN